MGTLGGQRRADRVRPGRRLGPGRPFLQADVVGPAQHPVLPCRHSTRPSASVTTMICCAASAIEASPARSNGISSPSAVLRRRCSISSASSSSLSGDWSGSMPLRTTRSQEASISARGATRDGSPVSRASRAPWSNRAARRSAPWPVTRSTPAEPVSVMVPVPPNASRARPGPSCRSPRRAAGQTTQCLQPFATLAMPCGSVQEWQKHCAPGLPVAWCSHEHGGWCRVGAAPPSVASRGV